MERVQGIESSYQVSKQLLDRIDIHVEVPAVKFREITAQRTGVSSQMLNVEL